MLVPSWTPAGRLMKFTTLTSAWQLPVYTVGWRITDNADSWTKRFLRFKEGNRSDVRGGALVLLDAIDDLMKNEKMDPATTGVAGALKSSGTKSDPATVLHKVSFLIAKHKQLHWCGDRFTKLAHRSLHGIPNGAERDAEVTGKYTCAPMPEVKALIIVDDFVTRGATISEMRRAARVVNPNLKVAGLALGKNESASFAGDHGVTVNNTHIPVQWDNDWLEGAKGK